MKMYTIIDGDTHYIFWRADSINIEGNKEETGMKVYKIETASTLGQPHYVVAKNMAEAEKIYLGKYWPTEIKVIECISNYVQVQGFDEQPKKDC